MTKDELWEKYSSAGVEEAPSMGRDDFLAALHEYGQAVRARDAEIARSHNPKPIVPEITAENIACAAAISREPLP